MAARRAQRELWFALEQEAGIWVATMSGPKQFGTSAPRQAPVIDPPGSVRELVDRAGALEGQTLDAVASLLGRAGPATGLHAKGKTGELLERALGATGGAAARVDFPELGVELKTLPVGASGRPRETTFVCAVRVDEADTMEWDTSWVREKLRRVLFVPILEDRRIGRAFLWEPTADEDAVLRADFDDIMGLIGVGRIEDVSARLGTYLQLRPKARDGTPRALAFGRQGERIRTVPRGFYLRTSFTARLLDLAPQRQG